MKIIIAYNGTEVIDATPESLERAEQIRYTYERKEREKRFKRNRNMFQKLAAMCEFCNKAAYREYMEG